MEPSAKQSLEKEFGLIKWSVQGRLEFLGFKMGQHKDNWTRFEDISYKVKKISLRHPELAKGTVAEAMLFLVDLVFSLKSALASEIQSNKSLRVHNDLLKEKIKSMESSKTQPL